MADRLRQLQQLAQKLKDKVHLSSVNVSSRDKVDQFITKYAPASKVAEIAQKFKSGSFSVKVQELVTRYEKFTGVEEIMAIQHTVVEAQVSCVFLFLFVTFCVLCYAHTQYSLNTHLVVYFHVFFHRNHIRKYAGSLFT